MTFEQMKDTLDYELTINSVTEEIVEDMEEYETVEEAIDYLKDVFNHGCASGIVTNLIYNTDCKEFFHRNSEAIADILFDYQMEFGIKVELNLDRYSYVETQLSWLAYELETEKILLALGEF